MAALGDPALCTQVSDRAVFVLFGGQRLSAATAPYVVSLLRPRVLQVIDKHWAPPPWPLWPSRCGEATTNGTEMGPIPTW